MGSSRWRRLAELGVQFALMVAIFEVQERAGWPLWTAVLMMLSIGAALGLSERFMGFALTRRRARGVVPGQVDSGNGRPSPGGGGTG